MTGAPTTRSTQRSPGSVRKGHTEEGQLSRGSNEGKRRVKQLPKEKTQSEEAASAKTLRHGHVWFLRVQQGCSWDSDKGAKGRRQVNVVEEVDQIP